ncbi:FecCD family ABC transporter permease [Burkholderia sp. WAC0059]|uniref:FecCD family ABC transporter permease n=1 Tax=Burkholderia sp. WAC0059 TaxID=2066022 RepID=UPI0021550D87|nr:iron ABC transporter permease [Burkholderia sp. WAC0059]
MRDFRQIVRIGALTAVLLISIGAAVSTGAYRIDPATLWHLAVHGLWAPDSLSDTAQAASVLWHIRLPRVMLAVALGAGLGLCGCALQALLRNPLSDPGLIGVSSGAALGAASMLVVGERFMAGSSALVPLASFAGALGTAALVYRLAAVDGRLATPTLLLCGIAVNALAVAAIGILTYLANDAQLRSLTFWTLGSLGGAQWRMLGIAMPFVALGAALLVRRTRALNVMQLGEAEAAHLGVATHALKREIVIGVSLCVGALVSCSGLIGFVGLVTPHCARLLCGPDLRRAMPASMLAGASLAVLADLAARTVAAPADVPLGILTALIGAPFFLFLVWRHRHRLGA